MKTIVFDLDGTLLDSTVRHTLLLQDVCMELQIPIAEKMLAQYLTYKRNGYSTRKYLVDLCGFSEIDAKKCSDLWIDRIETESYIKHDKLYMDSKNLLEMLAQKDSYKIILLTARQNKELLMWQLSQLQIINLFHQIICVSPKNANEEKVKAMRLQENVFCLVGDTEVDYAAAEKVNCRFYAINRGFRSEDYWKKKGIMSYSGLSHLYTLIE